MRMLLTMTLVLLVLAAGGYFGWQEYDTRRAFDLRYQNSLREVERLLADVYMPPDPPKGATQKLKDFGCQEAWLTAPRSAVVRFSEAVKIVSSDPEFLPRLSSDDTPAGVYVRAMLVLRTPLREHPALAGMDPEQLLRRAAGVGYGHAMAYFVRMRADLKPHWRQPENAQDAADFFEINRQLEQAADAGSGSAAYLLGFRTRPELIEKFAAVDPESRRSPTTASRLPHEWWCRSAQLGYAPGQLQCYRAGGRRLSEAQELLKAAADGGHEIASVTLAAAYARGDDGFDTDLARQKEFLCRATALGHAPALDSLRRLVKGQAAASRQRDVKARREAQLKVRQSPNSRVKLVTPRANQRAKSSLKNQPSQSPQQLRTAH